MRSRVVLLQLQVRVDLGVRAMEGYSSFFRSCEQDPHHQSIFKSSPEHVYQHFALASLHYLCKKFLARCYIILVSFLTPTPVTNKVNASKDKCTSKKRTLRYYGFSSNLMYFPSSHTMNRAITWCND